MDRRRLEDAFFLFASMEMVAKCGMILVVYPLTIKLCWKK